ncbi:MAG: pyridoxal phosphate-dependent aminotransferase, partial [Candidatus Micrarchaeia archaeon]
KAKELEAQGKSIIHLEIGEPDFDTPSYIKEAAIKALSKGETHYTPTPGIPELRKAIAERTMQDFNVEVDWKDISLTVGAKEAIFVSLATIVEEGDEVIYPNPGYPAYEAGIRFFGGTPKPLMLKEENEFRMTSEEVNSLVSSKTKAIIINSPENPTGSVLSKDDIRGVVEIAKSKGIYVISDEIYKYIIYDGLKHHSPIQFDSSMQNTIIIDGFSKSYAMTGWRLGYIISPKHLTQPMQKILNLITSCPSSFSQFAALEALRGGLGSVKNMVEQYTTRRKALIEEVSQVEDISMVKPKGAFYGFINVKNITRKTNLDSSKLASILLENYGVAVLHGTAMGSNGEGYLRVSFANSIENIREGIRRMGNAFKELTSKKA